MKNAIILHGKPDPGQKEYYNPNFPSPSNSHWLPWLQKQLLIHDIAAQTPEMPNAWKPEYEIWQKEFERYETTPETILVGHSCGAGFIVRWLSEHPDIKVGKIVLVAPSLGFTWDDRSFFGFVIDRELANRTAGVTIFGSDNDEPSVMKAIAQYRSVLKDVKYREFPGYGHFVMGSMKTDVFPELLEETLHE